MLRLATIVIFVFILISCKNQKNTSLDVSAMHRWIENYMRSVQNSDVESLLSGEAESIIYYPPNQSMFSGKENLRKWYKDYFNYYEAKELLRANEIKVVGDLAYVSGEYKIAARIKGSGEEFGENGKFLNIFSRLPFDRWVCTYSMWNLNSHSLDLHAYIPADFSGSWELDLNRSTKDPGIVSSKIKIEQNGNKVLIDRTYEMEGGKTITSNLNCMIGHVVKEGTHAESYITDSFWSEDRKSFTIIEKILFKSQKEIRRTTVYSLIAKGENLNVLSYDSVPNDSSSFNKKRQIELNYRKLEMIK
jgi:ketosteroid isomerase-like protein